MGAWGSTVVASNANTYVVSNTSSTCSTDMTIQASAQQTKWPHQDGQTTYYTRRAEPDEPDVDLEQLLDDFLRHLAGIVAVWRVLHELLMEQENERVRTRPPPRGVPPADLVRSHRRPAPRAPPVNKRRPALIDRPGVAAFGWYPSRMPAFCTTCQRPTESDDEGACFGNGQLCQDCGYYRLAPKKPKTKRKRIAGAPKDAQTPTDPGCRVPDF